jgi:hypothetical protein
MIFLNIKFFKYSLNIKKKAIFQAQFRLSVLHVPIIFLREALRTNSYQLKKRRTVNILLMFMARVVLFKHILN